jgi:type II secretory pathway component PulM
MSDRRPLHERITAARARLQQMEAQAAQAARKADTVRKIVVGGTVMAAMETDSELRNRVIAILHERVTRPRDREAVSQWLASPEG